MSRICVLIPCYNEELTLLDTINEVRKNIDCDIIVGNNNCTDKTVEIALSNGCQVVSEFRKGKGLVMNYLFSTALSLKYDCFIMTDGDNTYSFSNIGDMVKLVENGFDMVVGDRLSTSYYKEQDNFIHKFGNKLVSFLNKILYTDKIDDPMSGLRVFSKKFVENYPCNVEGFEIEIDMNAWAYKNKLRVASLPVEYKDRPEGSFSKINPIEDGVRVLLQMIKCKVSGQNRIKNR